MIFACFLLIFVLVKYHGMHYTVKEKLHNMHTCSTLPYPIHIQQFLYHLHEHDNLHI